MLVVDMNAQFLKKANNTIVMKCEDGLQINETIAGLSKKEILPLSKQQYLATTPIMKS